MCCCSLEQLAYLTTTLFVCQLLFSKFFDFFEVLELFQILFHLKQLRHLTTVFVVCQQLF